MTLTADDLSKIRKVIREEVTSEVKDSTRTLDGEIRMSRMQIQQNISELDDRMKNVEIRVDNLGLKNDKNHKEVLKKLEIVSQTLDKQTVEVAKRVNKIENNLGLPTKN